MYSLYKIKIAAESEKSFLGHRNYYKAELRLLKVTIKKFSKSLVNFRNTVLDAKLTHY